MWERSTNHVKVEWERARKLEAEEKQRQYEEWLRQEVRVENGVGRSALSPVDAFAAAWYSTCLQLRNSENPSLVTTERDGA